MNADDLLSFKEFSPVHESHTRGGSAELNINSPQRNINPFGNINMNNNNNNNNMSTTIQMPASPTMDQLNIQSSNNANLQLPTDNNESSPAYSFFSIEYYQQFFNVDTSMVLERITSAMIPKRAPVTYLEKNIGNNPDLYGPLWIVITLVFSIAISGNIANYLHEASTNYHWQYNFHLVSYAATTIVLYICFVPFGLWSAFKWFVRPLDTDLETIPPYTPSLLTLICIYGYSLVIYIPVSILWVIPVSILQWLLVITATFLSGSVLVLILTPALRVSKVSLFIAIGIVVAHFLLAAGFMLYFFHVPESKTIIVDQQHAAISAAVSATPSVISSKIVSDILANKTI